jgi:two-component system chemotaxis sensor kinase CheA
MNRARILARALEQGLITSRDHLSDDQILDLVFRPGFSTATEVTNLSGRGVGMDVVRHNVESLRGTAHVESVEGSGTRIALRVPLTLTLVDGFCVRAGGETFLIPMDAVVECAPLPEKDAGSNEPFGVLSARGAALPFVRLRSVFGLEGGAPLRENVVVVRHSGGTLGFVVDSLQGTQRTVVKALGPLFRGTAGVSGAALVGDGGVALIIDIPSLVRVTLPRVSASLDQGAPS